jgi:integrase
VVKLLTTAAVERYRPAPKRRIIRDGGARSLFLVVHPSGQKSWLMRFRVPSRNQPAKIVLGPYDNSGRELRDEPQIGQPLTLAAARALATKVLRERAMGRDPAADREAEKQRRRNAAVEGASNTFGAASKTFVEKYASKKVRRWKEVARLLGLQPTDAGLEVVPGGLAERWGSRPVAEIDGHDIHAVVAETRERGAPGLQRRGDGPTEARARAMLSALSRTFRWLVEHRRVDGNPCAGVHRPEAPEARDRVLTAAELKWFWAATEKIGAPFRATLRLLLLTGCRLNEIAALRWEELSEDGITLQLPGSRTKNHRPHVVPLAPLAREVLAGAARIEGCPFVFSTTGMTPISGWSKAKHLLDEAMLAAAREERGRDATIEPWRLHDLRRSAVTGMAELGIAPHVIELCVNHVSGSRGGVAGVYNRSEMMPERRAALERWAQHVAGVVSGKAEDKVVAMPRGRGRRARR